ncbi:MAG: ASCH domain-containing protein, partial [Chloroflexota bacterium]
SVGAQLRQRLAHLGQGLPPASGVSRQGRRCFSPRGVPASGVEIVPFNEVTAVFAATEGEGDGSLAYWRRVHWAFFTRDLANWGLEPTETMPVICEVFEVVFPASDSHTQT